MFRTACILILLLSHGTSAEPKQPHQLPELRKELLKRKQADQKIRNDPQFQKAFRLLAEQKTKKSTSPIFQNLLRIDKENQDWLKKVIDKHGWPGKTLVGIDGEHAAWLLVQHANRDPAFQKQCLKLMQQAPQGEVRPKNIAYLDDRIRIADGKKQRFGTQIELKNGKWVTLPVEDPEHLDQRRKKIGLPPIKDYLKLVQKTFDMQKDPDQRSKK